MIRALLIFILTAATAWAPWMDTASTKEIAEEALVAFGPVPSVCFTGEGDVLQDGVSVHWYPFGRMVHTCSGDYVVWMWGSIKELGGVYKKATDIEVTQAKALTCDEVVQRRNARQATTTDDKLVLYTGETATRPDYSLFKEAEEQDRSIRDALDAGPVFAGKFAVASFECGGNCRSYAVVDVSSGLVVAYDISTEYGARYSVDSSWLVTNPSENLPALPDSAFETETVALSIARLPREYYQLTTDALSGTEYLVRLCVESSAAGYIEVEDDRLGVRTQQGADGYQ